MRDRRALVQRSVDLILLVVILLAAWMVNAEIFHLGGVQLPKKNETRPALNITPTQLGVDQWQVGSIGLKESGVYEATIVDAEGKEVFKLKLNAATGQVEEKERPSSSGMILPQQDIRQRVIALLPHLTIGGVTRKQEEPFAQPTLLYEGRTAARIKVDPVTRQPINPG